MRMEVSAGGAAASAFLPRPPAAAAALPFTPSFFRSVKEPSADVLLLASAGVASGRAPPRPRPRLKLMKSIGDPANGAGGGVSVSADAKRIKKPPEVASTHPLPVSQP
jgi:hypothetical protein